VPKYNNDCKNCNIDRNSETLLIESSDSDSEDEENELLLMTMINKKHFHVRNKNYVERVVPLYTDEEFQMHFRYVNKK